MAKKKFGSGKTVNYWISDQNKLLIYSRLQSLPHSVWQASQKLLYERSHWPGVVVAGDSHDRKAKEMQTHSTGKLELKDCFRKTYVALPYGWMCPCICLIFFSINGRGNR